jgi:hypothetical protein
MIWETTLPFPCQAIGSQPQPLRREHESIRSLSLMFLVGSRLSKWLSMSEIAAPLPKSSDCNVPDSFMKSTRHVLSSFRVMTIWAGFKVP